MRRDITDLKKLVYEIMQETGRTEEWAKELPNKMHRLFTEKDIYSPSIEDTTIHHTFDAQDETLADSEVLEESLSLEKRELELIRKALEKHGGKRKNAARELGISERTLYRKIKEYDLND